jgi:endonuclease/exonuclease/phosphatase family metal-dependent hydrolase
MAPRIGALVVASVLTVAAVATTTGGAQATSRVPTTGVMTRNLYLGADLGPGVRAQNLQELVNAAGTILHQVDANKFGVRARGLAAEIARKSPDLVGMQEVSLWRTAPCTENPIPPKATHVRYDYLKRLLKTLNKDGQRYRLVISKNEFDFEVYANTDGNESTSAPGCPLGSEINVRLTMRDAIIAKPTVATDRPRAGTFKTLLQERPSGIPVDVTRGWTSVNAKIGGARPIRFVNTHLEAFDSQKHGNHTNHGTDVDRGRVREAQARELFAAGGPAAPRSPLLAGRVVLVGDLNSDKYTVPRPGDKLAHTALLNAGFLERSTHNPLGCCLNASLITANGGGSVSDFDHQVDHVMTNDGNFKLVSSAVTGRQPTNGFWHSDHAGLFSELTIP